MEDNITVIGNYVFKKRDLLGKGSTGSVYLGSLPQNQALNVFRGIVAGYFQCVQQGIIHRDLKPNNILMNKGVPKISDFGYCEIIGNKPPNAYYNVGSPSYMPPEAYQENRYSQKSDIWALGAVLYQMLIGKTLDHGYKITQLYKIFKAGLQNIDPRISSRCLKIIVAALKYNPRDRVTAKGLQKMILQQSQSPESLLTMSMHPHPQLHSRNMSSRFFQEQKQLPLSAKNIQTPRHNQQINIKSTTYLDYNKSMPFKIQTRIQPDVKTLNSVTSQPQFKVFHKDILENQNFISPVKSPRQTTIKMNSVRADTLTSPSKTTIVLSPREQPNLQMLFQNGQVRRQVLVNSKLVTNSIITRL